MKRLLLVVMLVTTIPMTAWSQPGPGRRRPNRGGPSMMAPGALPPAQPAHGLEDSLSGAVAPLTLKLQDLTAEWRRVTVSNGDSWTQLFAAESGGNSSNVYYTKGQTVAIGNDTLLVTYHLPAPPFDAAAASSFRGSRFPPVPDKLSGDTVLELALLNIHAINGLNSIRPFELQRELAENSAQVNVARKARAEAIGTTSLGNLQQIGMLLHSYTQESKKLPPLKDAAALQAALSRYGSSSPSPYLQPDTKEPYKTNAALSGKALAGIAHPDRTIVLYESAATDDGTRGVLFADGQVQRIQEATWPQLQTQSLTAVQPKVVVLTGPAALYYIYKKHQHVGPGQVPYFLSMNGRVYYRDPQNHQAHWVTPPPGGIQVPASAAAPYQEFQGYNNNVTGRDLTNLPDAIN